MRTEKIRISRETIDAEQAIWEKTQPFEFSFDEATGELYIPGLDMGKFREVLGPERYYQYLGTMGIAQIDDTPKTGGSRADDLLEDEDFEQIEASRPRPGLSRLRPPEPVKAVTYSDIVGPEETRETIAERRAARAANQAALSSSRRARNWRRGRRTLR